MFEKIQNLQEIAWVLNGKKIVAMTVFASEVIQMRKEYHSYDLGGWNKYIPFDPNEPGFDSVRTSRGFVKLIVVDSLDDIKLIME